VQATLLIVPADDSEMVRCATVNESSMYDCWAETLATSTNTNTNTDDMEVAVRVIAGAATPRRAIVVAERERCRACGRVTGGGGERESERAREQRAFMQHLSRKFRRANTTPRHRNSATPKGV